MAAKYCAEGLAFVSSTAAVPSSSFDKARYRDCSAYLAQNPTAEASKLSGPEGPKRQGLRLACGTRSG